MPRNISLSVSLSELDYQYLQIIKDYYKMKNWHSPELSEIVRLLLYRHAAEVEAQVKTIRLREQQYEEKVKEYQFKVRSAKTKLGKLKRVTATLVAQEKDLKTNIADKDIIGTPISPNALKNPEMDLSIVPKKYLVKIGEIDQNEN